jgi:hypothetical protein
MSHLLFDIGTIGVALLVCGIVAVTVIAYVAFRVLRRTVKMALRLAIAAAIIAVGLVAVGYFLYYGYYGS